MKFIVDKIPEHPSKCLFSKRSKHEENKYVCTLGKEDCPYYDEGWHKECPFLKEETKPVNYSFLTNGTYSYLNSTSNYNSTSAVSNLGV
jgi:hypothetical protein